MSKHTPGPWEVDLETGEITALTTVLGTIYGADDYPCCEEDIDEECKANATLIAAAPDLLAACIQTREAIRELIFADYDLAMLDAAIAKAKGAAMSKYTRVRRTYPAICERCLGSGFVATKHGAVVCPICKGTGYVERWFTEIVYEEEHKPERKSE